MNSYTLRMKVNSEMIFGSGKETNGIVDEEVLVDESGFPYSQAKTLKGKLREQAQIIVDSLNQINKESNKEELESTLIKLFGSVYGESESHRKNINGVLRISDLELYSEIKTYSEEMKKKLDLTKEEVVGIFTNIRNQISVEDGVSKDGSLRNVRTIKKGFIFYSNIELDLNLTEKEEALLVCSAEALKHYGKSISRGRGEVEINVYSKQNKLEAANLIEKLVV